MQRPTKPSILGAEGLSIPSSPLANTSSSWSIGSPTMPPSQCGQAFIGEALPLHLPPQLTIFVPPRPKLIPLVNSAVRIAEGSLTNEEGSERQWKALTWLSASWQGLGDIMLIVGHVQGSYSSNSSEPTAVTIKEIIHTKRRNGIKRLLVVVEEILEEREQKLFLVSVVAGGCNSQ